MNRRPLGSWLLCGALLLGACTCLWGGEQPSASAEAARTYDEALVKWEAGDAAGAEAAFQKAASLAPQWGAPNARLGVIYQLQGKQEQAREQYAIVQSVSLPAPSGAPSLEEVTRRAQIIQNEAYVIYLVNSARLENSQPVLVPDPTVAVVARLHSEEMRDKDYFSHTSPTPGLATVQDRFRAIFGYKPRCIGENVSRRWGSEYSLCTAKMLQTHVDLMASPGHRHNILYPTFEWLGVGIAVTAAGDYWMTEVFVESGR